MYNSFNIRRKRYLPKLFLLGLVLNIAFVNAVFAEEEFKFIILGDRTGSHVPGVYKSIVAEIERIRPDFIINVGDLIEGYISDADSINKEWDEVLAVLDKTSLPYYLIPGNHDIWDTQSESIYVKRCGKPYYSFDYKNTHFVILDNSIIESWEEIPEEQYDWVRNDLKKHRKAQNIFCFFHKPFWYDAIVSNATDKLHELFKEYGVDRVFSGHWHVYANTEWDGIIYTIVGSSGGGMEAEAEPKGAFFHYLLVTVEDENVHVAVIKAGNVLPPDVVTLADRETIKKIEQEYVKLNPFEVIGEDKKIKGNITVIIKNIQPDTLNTNLKWSLAAWQIVPESVNCSIAPGTDANYSFNCQLKDITKLYPLPSFKIPYVYKASKECLVKKTVSLDRIAICKKIKSSPIIDGNIDDPCWKKIKPLSVFAGGYGDASKLDNTEVFLAYDDSQLYIATRCTETETVKMKADCTERDGTVWQDDNLWFFFDTNHDKTTYYQLMVNPNGAIFDRSCKLEAGTSTKDISWNGPWNVKSGRGEGFWTLEISVPLADLGSLKPKIWGFNVRRLQTRLDDACVWSLPFEHNPTTFAELRFE
jgi:UDP-2,3-diacylglucosamine pyrophosphatase LpxH